MRVLSLSTSASVKLWGSIFELPAGRHAEMQYWLVRDAGFGSDAASIEQRFAQTSSFLAAGRTEDAGDALALLHYAFTHALDKFSARHLAFGCLVAEWQGQPWTDTSEEGLTRLRDELSAAGLTEGMVLDELETVKKEWRRN